MTELSETELREFLLDYVEGHNEKEYVIMYFLGQILSLDFMREIVDLLDEQPRIGLENNIAFAVIDKGIADGGLKMRIGQSHFKNSITYIKGGLVKYRKELNDVVR